MIPSFFLESLAGIIHIAINAYIWVVVISALLSWVKPDPYNPIVMTLSRLTEPVFYMIRKRVNTYFNGIDLAPMIVLLALYFLDLFLVRTLYYLAGVIQ